MEVTRNEPTIEPTENEDCAEQMDSASTSGTIPQRHGTDDLLSIWETGSMNKTICREDAFEKTILFLKNQVEGLVSLGVDAFHRSEKAARELKVLKEELKSKDEELERTRLSEEKSRATVANLLNALEVSRVGACEDARSAMTEAQLRADVSVFKRQRDEAQSAADESARKVTLLQDELHQTKTKLARVTQEKMKMDRDQRVAMSIARSLDSSAAGADVDYYKRKVSELSGNLQSMYTTLAEKDRQLENLRSQLERNMSQNSLAQWRNGDFESSRKRIFK